MTEESAFAAALGEEPSQSLDARASRKEPMFRRHTVDTGGKTASPRDGGPAASPEKAQRIALRKTVKDADVPPLPLFATAREMEDVMRRWMEGCSDKIVRIQADSTRLKERHEVLSKNTANRIIRQWRCKHEARAFEAWQQLMTSRGVQKRKALAHWTDGLRVRTYASWVDWFHESRAQRAAAARAMKHWGCGLQARAFTTWCGMTAEVREARTRLMRRATSRWTQAILSLVLEAWVEAYQSARFACALGKRALMRLHYGVLAVAFFAWSDEIAAALQARRAAFGSAIARFINRNAAMALDAWRSFVHESIAARAEQVRRAAARFTNRLAAIVLDAWVAYIAHRRAVFAQAAYAIGPGRLPAEPTWAI